MHQEVFFLHETRHVKRIEFVYCYCPQSITLLIDPSIQIQKLIASYKNQKKIVKAKSWKNITDEVYSKRIVLCYNKMQKVYLRLEED